MYILRCNATEEFERSALKFKSLRKVRIHNNVFHFQSCTYQDKDFYIEVPFFKSNGMTQSSFSNMLQMRVTFPKWQQKLLNLLDMAAREHAQCPEDANTNWKSSFNDGSAYKDIADYEHVFLKLSECFQAFDVFRNTMDTDDLKRGNYMALIHVTGIYVGGHGPTGKLASLQMKLTQLLYQPIPHDECFIQYDTSVDKTPMDVIEKEETVKEKRSRKQTENLCPLKPKLKRGYAEKNLSKRFPSDLFDEETRQC